jgi:type IV pilus assembly protein PilA
MRKLRTRRGGFTLIELMIVVAIIGILAAIAIPNFLKFQLRSKTGEAKTNLAALRTAEEGYFAEYGVYVGTGTVHPAGAASPSKQDWTAPAVDFDTVGWGPEGDVYFTYAVTINGTAYSLDAVGELDGGGLTSDFGYIHPVPGAVAGIAPTRGVCQTSGVWNAAATPPAPNLLDTVGQCGPLDGQDEF